MDSLRYVTMAGVMVAAVAGYIFWGPSNKPKTKAGQIPGLVNMGNTCFLNAVLQALASCPSFFQWLSMVVSRHDVFQNGNQLSLSRALLEALEVLNNYRRCSTDEYEPHKILSALRGHHWIISPDEQDAHELFLVLSSTIEEELGMSKDSHVFTLADVKMLEITGSFQPLCSIPSTSKVLVPFSPFKGLLTSRLMCKRCEFKCPLKYDTFDSLSLSIPPMSQGVVTLQTCLRYFVMSELVPNVECESCAENMEVDIKTTFLKQLSIGKLPTCLCIHIQRTVWLQNGMPMKRFEHVVCPEILNMEEFLCRNQSFQSVSTLCKSLVGGSGVNNVESADSQSNFTYLSEGKPHVIPRATISARARTDKHSYRLQAVIVHLGDVFSGHFVTYRRGALNSRNRNSWYLTSDATVQGISLKEVLRYPAYVLFYEKIAPGSGVDVLIPSKLE